MIKTTDIEKEPPIFGDVLLCAVISNEEIVKLPPQIRYRNFVYMIEINNEVIYVGRTTNLRLRLSGWKRRWDFDKIYLCEYSTHRENCQAERYYIKHYRPLYNWR